MKDKKIFTKVSKMKEEDKSVEVEESLLFIELSDNQLDHLAKKIAGYLNN